VVVAQTNAITVKFCLTTLTDHMPGTWTILRSPLQQGNAATIVRSPLQQGNAICIEMGTWCDGPAKLKKASFSGFIGRRTCNVRLVQAVGAIPYKPKDGSC